VGVGTTWLAPVLTERPALPQKEVKVEAQVEQRSIRSGRFSTLNLDLSRDLSLGRAQWKLNQSPSLEITGELGRII